MKKKFIERCYQFIIKYQQCDELKTKKIKYGLEAIYNLITKLIVMFIISIILNIWKEYLLFLFVYSWVKKYTYGIHAKKSIICWCTTLPIYIFGCYFIKYFFIPKYLIYLICFLSLISFILWAPSDTPSLPLIHADIRKKQKIKACLIWLIYFLLIFILKENHLTNAILYSLIIQSICINPITYKITKTPFENYKLYYKNHGLNY